MPLVLVLLILVASASLALAGYQYLSTRDREEIIARAGAPGRATTGVWRDPMAARAPGRLSEWLRATSAVVPQRWRSNEKTESALVQAGYDHPMAPLAYGLLRVVLLVGLPLLAAILIPATNFDNYLFCLAAAAIVGALIPMWLLVRTVRLRQERIRHSLPDALDLLVVCIEAGISLDAAILRVAKDLGTVHPELAEELLIVNRKTNLGIPRADALQGLWNRTGVDEVRILVTHITQGEKWGTSSGRVLRTYAETLRRQRRQSAEKKAATAPVKMLVPLGLFIFPALLLAVLGPVILNVVTLFKK